MIDLDQIDPARLRATMTTSKGDMVIRFFTEQAPRHVRNFVQLALDGFYDGLAFHRTIRNFMIQGGCPNTRAGAKGTPGCGSPGWTVDAEFNEIEHRRGVVSMARGPDPNSAGSQFFIVHAEHCAPLDGEYTAFGRVVDGLDVLDAIANVECDFGPSGERSRPRERVAIERVTVDLADVEAEAPAEAEAGADPESAS